MAGAPAARPPRPCPNASGQRSRENDSSSDEDEGPPCYDGGIDNNYDDTCAPFSNPAPARLRQLDTPQQFDCCQPKRTVAEIAPKNPKLHVAPTRQQLPRPFPGMAGDPAGGSRGSSGGKNSGYNGSSRGRSVDAAGGPKVVVRRGGSQGPALMQTMTPEPDSYSSFLNENASDQGRLSGQPTSHGRAGAPPGFKAKPRQRAVGRA